MTKKLPPHVKLLRKPIGRACVFCHQKHLQCDPSRPCRNCLKRNVAGKCEDVQRKRNKPRRTRRKDNPEQSSLETAPASALPLAPEIKPEPSQPPQPLVDAVPVPTAPDVAKMPQMAQVSGMQPSLDPSMQSMPFFDMDSDFDTKFDFFDELVPHDVNGLFEQPATRPFILLGAGNTESTLTEEPPASTPESLRQEMRRVPLREFAQKFKSSQIYRSPLMVRKKVFQEVSDLYLKLPLFDLEAVQKGEASTELRTALGVLSFSYMKLYQELIKYFYDRLYLQTVPTNTDYAGMDSEAAEKARNIRKKLFFKMLEKIWTIHNHFRIQLALIQTDLTFMTNYHDSLLTEMILQRQLLNFEGMITGLTCTPAIIWRRSTEIVFISDELCTLVGIRNKGRFLSRRRFLCEMIDDLSILNYFRLFNDIVMDNKHSAGYHSVHSRVDSLKNHFNAEMVEDLKDELCELKLNNGSGVISGGLIRFNCKFINYNYTPTQNHHLYAREEDDFPLSESTAGSLEPFINTSSILTIKKDMFDIPMLIVGQFLPILE